MAKTTRSNNAPIKLLSLIAFICHFLSLSAGGDIESSGKPYIRYNFGMTNFYTVIVMDADSICDVTIIDEDRQRTVKTSTEKTRILDWAFTEMSNDLDGAKYNTTDAYQSPYFELKYVENGNDLIVDASYQQLNHDPLDLWGNIYAIKSLLMKLWAENIVIDSSCQYLSSGIELPTGEHPIEFEPIDEREYLTALEDIGIDNIYPKEFTGDSAIKEEFLFRVIKMDAEARNAYLESLEVDAYDACDSYDLFEVNLGNTTIYILRFIMGVYDFCYIATMNPDGTLSISDVKMDSAFIACSKDGYIAGFEEMVDEYYVSLTIYKFSLDTTNQKASLTKIGTFTCGNDSPWKYDFAHQHPAFWLADTVYIAGRKLVPVKYIDSNKDIGGYYEYEDLPAYYKLTIRH